MRTLNGRAKNLSSNISASSTGACGGPAKSGIIQASAYPRIPKGTLLARAPDVMALKCVSTILANQYKLRRPTNLLG